MSVATLTEQEITNKTQQALGQIITLRSVFGKLQGPLAICPVRDPMTGGLQGVANLTEEQRRNAVRVVDEGTTRKITDGMTLNLSSEMDRIDWEWMQHSPAIAINLLKAAQSPRAFFYVENLVRETDERVTKRKSRMEAMSLVLGLSFTDRKQLARVLGQLVDAWESRDLEDYLTELAETDPEKVLNAYRDGNFKTRVFFYQLLDKGEFSRRDGAYYFGDVILGTSDSQVLAWLVTPSNSDIVEALYMKLNPIRDVAATVLNTYPDPIARLEAKQQEQLREQEKQLSARPAVSAPDQFAEAPQQAMPLAVDALVDAGQLTDHPANEQPRQGGKFTKKEETKK
jgi:hypothetical protein